METVWVIWYAPYDEDRVFDGVYGTEEVAKARAADLRSLPDLVDIEIEKEEIQYEL